MTASSFWLRRLRALNGLSSLAEANVYRGFWVSFERKAIPDGYEKEVGVCAVVSEVRANH